MGKQMKYPTLHSPECQFNLESFWIYVFKNLSGMQRGVTSVTYGVHPVLVCRAKRVIQPHE